MLQGRDFDGNGRTCATCHPPSNNFTIDPEFIKTLQSKTTRCSPESVPELEDLESANLLRKHALFLENLDGFPPNVRYSAASRTTSASASRSTRSRSSSGPTRDAVGWSGDGAPDDGSIRDFLEGAIQHFTRTLAREPGDRFQPADCAGEAMRSKRSCSPSDARTSRFRGDQLRRRGRRSRQPLFMGAHGGTGMLVLPRQRWRQPIAMPGSTATSILAPMALIRSLPPPTAASARLRGPDVQHAAAGRGRGHAAVLPQQQRRDPRGGRRVLHDRQLPGIPCGPPRQRCVQPHAAQIDQMAAFLRAINAPELTNILRMQRVLSTARRSDSRPRPCPTIGSSAVAETYEDAIEVLNARSRSATELQRTLREPELRAQEAGTSERRLT